MLYGSISRDSRDLQFHDFTGAFVAMRWIHTQQGIRSQCHALYALLAKRLLLVVVE